jgi:hypothetical protein
MQVESMFAIFLMLFRFLLHANLWIIADKINRTVEKMKILVACRIAGGHGTAHAES